MCGGGGRDNSAEEARKREEARQGRIDQGSAELQRVFAELYGNEYRPTTPIVGLTQQQFDDLIAGVDQNAYRSGRQTAGLQDGYLQQLTQAGFSAPERMTWADLGLDPNDFDQMVGRYAEQVKEQLRQQYQAALSDNENSYELVEGVRDPIWEQYRTAYLDSANTQLQQQMRDAGQQVSRSLGRGQRGSSIQQNRSDDLYKQEQLAQLSVNQNAEQAAVQREAQVADAYNSALATLNSTANPSQAVDQAQRELSTLSNLNTTPVLGQLFNTAAITGAAGYSGYQQGQQAARYNNIVNSPVASNATVRW